VEGLDAFRTRLKATRDQGLTLKAAAVSLGESLAAMSDELARRDQMQRLRSLETTITAELERAHRSESTASLGRTQAAAIFSLVGLALKMVTAAATDNPQARRFVDTVFSTNDLNKPPCGTVMVCIGSKGLPDDVRVVSISELARGSNRPELTIIGELHRQGYLLLSEQAFTDLMGKLAAAIMEDSLTLPVPTSKVTEVAFST